MRSSRFALLIGLLMCAPLRAENWPQWRGPAGTGFSSEKALPDRWSDKENIAWRSPVRGVGISSPIVWGDRVFVTSQIGRGMRRPGNHPRLVQGGNAATAGEREIGGPQDNSGKVVFVVTALSRIDGRLLWEYQLPAEGELAEVHDKNNLASSSPVTDGQRLYAWFGTGQLIALDMDGKALWSRHLGRESLPSTLGGATAAPPCSTTTR